MQRKNIHLVAELCALAVIVLAIRLGAHIPAVANALASDKALMAHWELWAAWAGWLIFSLYWEIAKEKTAAAKSAESPTSRGLHVFLANVALLLVAAPIRGLGRFMPISSPVMAVGLVIEAMGLFVAIWARRHLGRNWSGEITIKVDHQLIRSGPYARLRHPIYTGLLAMYAGTVLVTGGWLALIGLAMAALAYGRKLRLEEANMVVAFGAEYDHYRRESWALVPGLF